MECTRQRSLESVSEKTIENDFRRNAILKALVIGAAGFVGKYLTAHLTEEYGDTVYATKLPSEQPELPGAEVYDLDILDQEAVSDLLKTLQPDCIYHLAAQSSVAVSWSRPDLTVDINIKGTLHILEAARSLAQKPRIMLIGSGEEYGYVKPEDCPLREDTKLRPANIYAVTKACAENLAAVYERAYGMWIVSVRAFNHVGPAQLPQFVVADFCKQAVEIAYGLREPVIRTGNLTPKRDFTDVRDIVRAYGALMRDGRSGEVYNVGSGKAMAISELLEEIRNLSDVPFRIETDPEKLRPTDLPLIEADISKLQSDTGWKPEYSLSETLIDTLDYWRRILKKEDAADSLTK